MFLWINLHDQDLISAWYGKHGLCLLLCLFYHDTVSLCEVFRREVFPSYTSWVASKKSASLSKPKMTQVVKWMPVLKKRKSFPFAHVRKFTWKKKDIFFHLYSCRKKMPRIPLQEASTHSSARGQRCRPGFGFNKCF